MTPARDPSSILFTEALLPRPEVYPVNEPAEVCRYCGTHAEGDPSVPCPFAADLAAALAADETEDARRRAEQAAIDSRLDTGYWPDEDAPAVVNPDGTPTAFTLAFFGR